MMMAIFLCGCCFTWATESVPMKSILTICQENKLLIDCASKWILKSNFVHKLNFTHHSRINGIYVPKVTDVTNAWKLIEDTMTMCTFQVVDYEQNCQTKYEQTIKVERLARGDLVLSPIELAEYFSSLRYSTNSARKHSHTHTMASNRKIVDFGGNKIRIGWCSKPVNKTTRYSRIALFAVDWRQ